MQYVQHASSLHMLQCTISTSVFTVQYVACLVFFWRRSLLLSSTTNELWPTDLFVVTIFSHQISLLCDLVSVFFCQYGPFICSDPNVHIHSLAYFFHFSFFWKKMPTGDVEVVADDFEILNNCTEMLPVQIHDHTNVSIRLKYCTYFTIPAAYDEFH